MEMVKYLMVAVAIFAALGVADQAEARGRRGCSSCYTGGGCPGGVCAVPVAPGKMAVVSDAPPAVVADAPAPAPLAVAPAPAPAARPYYASGRRGVFGWRR